MLNHFIDDIARSVTNHLAVDGQFNSTDDVFDYCCELLMCAEEYQFPVLNPNISRREFLGWSVYWDVEVLPCSISISLIDAKTGDIISRTYRL
ncbi:hypothetical protein [Shewanella phaeophyticola]|uniref:Uncharacterized protein n=1 Tax=Shewanella phaeophyticola TaxID=2978345 RepID=A0ABT2P3D5_9GAMM|nr:hypothetical protein [Shewanella sp. KJ10-1]MCT8985766.1 hypothetical protein [Shewanella sp. KJ10-1]